MTWLFPVVSNFLFAIRRRSAPVRSVSAQDASTLTVIVPAHNEERSIQATLSSVQEAIRLRGGAFAGGVRIVVGADGCTDKTVSLATAHGATVYENDTSKGKWSTLIDLIHSNASSEWIALADAGIVWPSNLLSVASKTTEDKSVMGIAPSYAHSSAGRMESTLWSIEKRFKSIETKSGGPVSVHGATVLYRTKELLRAVESVAGQEWLNDDVVLPLVLRAQNPGLAIRYLPELEVVDSEDDAATSLQPKEFGRRRRMVIGNIQWIRQLLIPMFWTNPLAALVAMRRVFRVLWAYWVGFAVLGLLSAALQSLSLEAFRQVYGLVMMGAVLLSMVGLICSSVPFIAAAIARKVPAFSRLWSAGVASISTPFYFIPSIASGAAWK